MIAKEIEKEIIDTISFLYGVRIISKVAVKKKQHDSQTLQTQYMVRINTSGISDSFREMAFKLIRTAFGKEIIRPPIHVVDHNGTTRFIFLGESKIKKLESMLSII